MSVKEIYSSQFIDVANDYIASNLKQMDVALREEVKSLAKSVNVYESVTKTIKAKQFDLEVNYVKEPFNFNKMYFDENSLLINAIVIFLLFGPFLISLIILFTLHYLGFDIDIIFYSITAYATLSFTLAWILSYFQYKKTNANVSSIKIDNKEHIRQNNDIQRALLMSLLGLLIKGDKDIKIVGNDIPKIVNYVYLADDKSSMLRMLSEQEAQAIMKFMKGYESLLNQGFEVEEIFDVLKAEFLALDTIRRKVIDRIELYNNSVNNNRVSLSLKLKKIHQVINYLDTNNISISFTETSELSEIDALVNKIEHKIKHSPNIAFHKLDIEPFIEQQCVEAKHLIRLLNNYYKEIMQHIAKCVMA